MGRTIPSFRIAAIMEKKSWKQYRKFLNKKEDRKVFDNMFSSARWYNSASSYAALPIRIHPIIMSIVFHHYKTLNKSVNKFNQIEDYETKHNNHNNSSIIFQKELDKWKTYSDILRKPDRDLFDQMLHSSYKYSSAIDAKGEQFSTESLIISLLFEQQYKIRIK